MPCYFGFAVIEVRNRAHQFGPCFGRGLFDLRWARPLTPILKQAGTPKLNEPLFFYI